MANCRRCQPGAESVCEAELSPSRSAFYTSPESPVWWAQGTLRPFLAMAFCHVPREQTAPGSWACGGQRVPEQVLASQNLPPHTPHPAARQRHPWRWDLEGLVLCTPGTYVILLTNVTPSVVPIPCYRCPGGSNGLLEDARYHSGPPNACARRCHEWKAI